MNRSLWFIGDNQEFSSFMAHQPASFDPLPIDSALPDLRAALESDACVVLEAPPGAGKTTRVPLALLNSPWLNGLRMVMLEPRRLAARAAAHRMAEQIGESVGGTVGYRMRQDTRVSDRTRIEIVTEGVLTRMLLDDPALEGVGLVIFDEFHERSLPADAGLALCRQVRDILRPDLRLLVMSATLEARPLATFLNDAPIVRSEGRLFPIETRYLGHAIRGLRIEPQVADAVRRALREAEGDVLAFLPGAAEISRTAALLEGSLPAAVTLHPLFGNLTQEEQDRALAPAPKRARKVVLATSIAETSLTIDGVRVVVDSGLMRVPRFEPRTGMTRLVTLPVTRDAADQRRGRAGRQAPGVCYRLWSEHEQQHLHAARRPEILDADLAPLALDLAAWGVSDPAELAWLDVPPAAAFAQARDLLNALGALDDAGRLTDAGRRMAALPTHPRLAHMLMEARAMKHGALAADLTALLEERDILQRQEPPAAVDIRIRLELLAAARSGHRPGASWQHHQIKRSALHQVQRHAQLWRRHLHLPRNTPSEAAAAGPILALAYPDRIAGQTGSPGRFRLRDGTSAVLDRNDPLAEAPFLAIAHLGGRTGGARIFLAAPLALEDIEHLFADRIETINEVDWDRRNERVRARQVRLLGALALVEKPWPDADPETVARVLLGEAAARGLHVLNWTKDASRLRDRIAFLNRLDPAWPDVSDEALIVALPGWLGPFAFDAKSLDDLRRIDLTAALMAILAWGQQRDLDALAPDRIEVPSGSNIAIDYSDPAQPVLAVRLQEVFGMTETPRIARGQVALTMHLLSPAHRPVQVTRDLASFWRDTYFEVRKDLRGRYPKHYWPEDPMQAEATRRVRPK